MGRQFGGGVSLVGAAAFSFFWFCRIDFFEDVGEGKGKGGADIAQKQRNKAKETTKSQQNGRKKAARKERKKEGKTLEKRRLIVRKLQKNLRLAGRAMQSFFN